MGTRWGVVADPAESVGVGILMVQRHQFTAASAESVGSQAFISLALGRNRGESASEPKNYTTDNNTDAANDCQ